MIWVKRTLWVAALFGLGVAFLLGCAPSGTTTPSLRATTTSGTAVAPVSGTVTAAPTATTAPTSTAAPTASAVPTSTRAPTAAPTTPAAAAACAVGERCDRGGTALTVNSVKTTDTIDTFPTPAQGNTFLVVDVSIENTGAKDIPFNPLFFKVRAEDGTESNSTILAPSPSLKTGELTPGEHVRGNVAFEISQSATGLLLLYQPLVFPQPEAIRVNLGR